MIKIKYLIKINGLSESELRQLTNSWRALPRAFFLGLAFDGHISGGGALYNKVLAPVFEQLTNCPFWPIAFLSPRDENGLGILQYNSFGCRKTGAPYIKQAETAVSQNLVSLLDFFFSIRLANLIKDMLFFSNRRSTRKRLAV